MKESKKGLFFNLFLIAAILLPGLLYAQNAGIKPVTVGHAMPDFTLPTYQGGEITISQLKGKSIMIIFLRGLFKPGDWCHLGYYQYAELAELEKEKQIRKNNNLEILFVLPYNKEMGAEWFDEFPEKIADIEGWKNPPNADKLTGRRKAWMERIRNLCPMKIEYKKGEVPTPFPILIDAEGKVSKGLGLLTPNWDGGQGPMNIPTVFIIDKNGTLQFKHLSQNTFDRPSFEYLLKVLPCADYWGKSN